MVHNGTSLLWLKRAASITEPVRLRLIHLLNRRELTVAELCRAMRMPQSTVSRHLKVLLEKGWLQTRRQGTAHLYRMDVRELDKSTGRLWELVRKQTSDWPAVRQDRLRLERVLAERRPDVQRFFETAAEQWDLLRQRFYGRTVNAIAIAGLVPEGDTVADLGCGSGLLTIELAALARRVIAVDRSRAMLRLAQRRCRGLKNVMFRRAELQKLPIKTRTCDAALLVLVLSYIEDVRKVLTEAQRILKENGRLVVVDLLEHDRQDFRQQMGQCWMGFAEPQLRQWLTEAGLEMVRFRTCAPEPEAEGPAVFMAVGRKVFRQSRQEAARRK